MPNQIEIMNKLHQCWNLGNAQEFDNYLQAHIDQMNIEQIDTNGRTALWLAAALGSAQSVESLVKHKANKEA